MSTLKPFKFEPYLKSVLWGGEQIAEYKGIVTDQHNIGERRFRAFRATNRLWLKATTKA